MTHSNDVSRPPVLTRYWLAALACFVVAGTTGALYRFGLVLGLPWGLALTNVRHAHSHLMYFSWVTPALMALVVARLPEVLPDSWDVPVRRFRWPIVGALVLGLAAYPFFLLFGYQPVVVGSARLPLAAVIGSLNTFAWYGFVWAYVKTTWRAPRVLPLKLWDAAAAFLVLASLGGWGVAMAGRLGIDSLFITQAFTHLFLDLFADGWMVLALLGLATVSRPDLGRSAAATQALTLLIIGLPVTFLLTIPVGLVPPAVRAVAGLGGVLVGVALLMQGWLLRPRPSTNRWSLWTVPLFFLMLRAIAEIGIALPVIARWAERMNLRISYLHWLLLGFVTLGLVAAANETWPFHPLKSWRAFTIGVILIVVSLIPLTRLWPEAWSGLWVLWLAAIVTLIPVLVILLELMGRPPHRSQS
ncbi:MAG: hypothetical protein IPL78_21595 [Chloroflexi bacterium]|nr:hypothetical protein [Chloroflexota bacterium]